MFISDKGADIIKRFESFRSKAYQDSGGVWTIGWGTTRINGIPVRQGDVITIEKANKVFIKDVDIFAVGVIGFVKVPLNQNQFDALVSLAYNIGLGNFRKSSLLKKLNQYKYTEASVHFLDWVKAGGKKLEGLVRRRKAEKELFLIDIPVVLVDISKETKPINIFEENKFNKT